ncbi:TolC family protein [candidate division KSB1 bacterium]
MKKTKLILTAVMIDIILTFGHAEAFQAARDTRDNEPVTLGSLLNTALQNNPGIKALEHRLEASKMMIPQAGALPDPKLSFAIANMPLTDIDFSLEPMTSKQISVMQKIPFPGINGLKEKIAVENSEISGYSLSGLKLKIVRDVSAGFYDLYLLDRSVETAEKNLELLDAYIKISRTKYEVGNGIQQDILKAQLEYSRLEDKLITLRSRRRSKVSEINILLNRGTGTPIGKLEEQQHVSSILNAEDLEQKAYDNSPVLKSVETEIKKNEYEIQFSRKQDFPDIDIGIAYSQREDRRDFISAQFSMNIPLWKGRKQDMKVEEALLIKSSSEQRYEETKNSIRGEIADLVFRLGETDERIRFLQEIIIPQAEQSLSSAMEGYRVDKVDFLSLLNSQSVLFNLELDYYRLLTEYKKYKIKLEYITAENINEFSEGE